VPLKIEVFTSQPSCSGGRLMLRLLDEIKEEYGLTVSPAIIIDRDVRIIGVCPTKKTLREAIREAGVL